MIEVIIVIFMNEALQLGLQNIINKKDLNCNTAQNLKRQ